jgi:hypothetical protein
VVADLAPPGAGLRRHRIRLRTSSLCSVPMAWAVVGADAIGYLAVGCGFTVRELCRAGDRWTVVLEQQP